MHDLENRAMTRMSPRRSYPPRIAIAVAMAMLVAGCGSAREARPNEPGLKVDARTTAPSPQPFLYLQGNAGRARVVAVYADGRVIWEIGDGDPGYLQMRLTPEAVERLRSSVVFVSKPPGTLPEEQGWRGPGCAFLYQPARSIAGLPGSVFFK